MRTRPAKRRPGRAGFVLVAVLTLLAFLGTLLFTVSLLTRIETESAGNRIAAADARAHAWMALQTALYRLQASAGPDQRVTATADVTAGRLEANRFWTGVWASDGRPPESRFLGWLVSGAAADAASPVPPAEGVRMVGPATAGADPARWVYVGAEEVAGEAGRPGRFAFWVGDEGVKARFNLADPFAAAPTGSGEHAFRLQYPQRFGIERMTGFSAYKEAAAAGGTALRAALERMLHFQQIPLAGPEFPRGLVRERFHDLSVFSRGVLADVREGGLKRDLSRGLAPEAPEPAGPIFPGGPDWNRLRSYFSFRLPHGEAAVPRAGGEISPGIFPLPILVQLEWRCRLSSSGALAFQLRPVLVLGNPYDAPLAAADYELEWVPASGMEFTLTVRSGPSGQPETFVWTPGSSGTGILRLAVREQAFLPGEVKAFTLAADGAMELFIVLEEGTRPDPSIWVETDFTPAALEGGDLTIEVAMAAGSAGLRLRSGSGELLQVVEGCRFGAVQSEGAATESGVADPPIIALRARLGAPTALQEPAGRIRSWLAHLNPRSPRVRAPAGIGSGENPLWTGEAAPEAFAAGAGGSWGFGGDAAEDRFVVLYHLPRREPPGIGALAHADFGAEAFHPALALGNSWAHPYVPAEAADFGYRLNEALWDSYFVSSLPADGSGGDAGIPLPNARHRRLAAGQGLSGFRTAAAHLLVAGMFNVNSTSLEAWKALLGSAGGLAVPVHDPLLQESYAWNSSGGGSAVPFLRTPSPAGGPEDFWRGFRALGAEEIDRLAAQIVARIRSRGPFLSLAAFINRPLTAGPEGLSGLLQEAIDANDPVIIDGVAYGSTGINSGASEHPAEPDASLPNPGAAALSSRAGAPGYLTQADLLALLGPVISVRSDTFLIRGYGEAWNRTTAAIEARAWCEAVVQRVPEFVSPANAPEDPWPALSRHNAEFGRRFKMVYFRWLTPDDV